MRLLIQRQLQLLLLLMFCFAAGLIRTSRAQNPCQPTSGTSRRIVFTFTEAFGSYPENRPLPTGGQNYQLDIITGTARNSSTAVTADTIVLTLSDSTPLPADGNGTAFSPTGLFFELGVSAAGKGVVQLKQGIDREFYTRLPRLPVITTTGSIFLELRCRPDRAGLDPDQYTIEISIADINDNSPAFYNTSTNALQSTFSGVIVENTPVDSRVLQGVAVRDLDEGTNKALILVNASSSFLRVDFTGGFITVFVSRRINYEVDAKVQQVTTVIRDSPTNTSFTLTSTALFTFTILDQDDLPPAFEVPGCVQFRGVCANPTYTASIVSGINASSPLNVLPGPILARDQDSLNFTIRYAIVAGNLTSSFSIDSITGQVTQLAPIDRTVAPVVNLVIQATEFTTRTDVKVNGLYDTALLVITVGSRDSTPPALSLNLPSTQLFIAENSPIGSLVSNNTGSPLIVQVTDPDLISTDPPAKYSFQVTNTNLFRANADGSVAVNFELIDYETLSADKSILVTVQVTEASSTRSNLSSSISFNVSVTDVNDNSPRFSASEFAFLIGEGSGSRVVGSVGATDIDSGARGTAGIRYSISSGSSSLFSINSNSGQISVNGMLLRDQRYVLTVRAIDSEPVVAFRRAADVTVVITVSRLLNLPPIYSSTSYDVAVSEDTPSGTVLRQFPAVDPEGETVSYQIINQTVDGAFAYDSAGRLSVNASLDRESPLVAFHSILVGATDSLNNRTSTATIRVTLLDVNDNNPMLTVASTNISVPENEFPLNLTMINATDADAGQNARLQLMVMESSGSFSASTSSSSVGFISGQLMLTRSLDYEAKTVHYVTVLVRDSGQWARSATVTVTVNVVNRDDLAPLFPIRVYSAEVAENLAGADIVTVTAIDFEADPNVTYRLVSTSVPVSINASTGQIVTASAIDRETLPRFTILVSTEQSTLPAADATRLTATVSVVVLDANDNAPMVTASNFSILETLSVGAAVGNVTATDPDMGMNSLLRYSLQSVSPSEGAGLFTVNSLSGVITVASSLLASRSVNEFSLIVSVSDAGTPSLTTNQTIIVTLSRALQAPQPTPATFTVSIDVSATVGSFVANVNATDADTEPSFAAPLTFAIAGSAIERELFAINSSTGIVTLARNLTVDARVTYQLLVSVADPSGLSATATVTVSVNRNLHSPTLAPATQSISVQEDTFMGVDLGAKFTAADADLQAPFNSIRFSFTATPAAAAAYFDIDAENGSISLRRSLVGVSFTSVALQVTASDGGSPARSSPAVAVSVSIVSNNAFPQFPQAEYSYELPGNVTNFVIAAIVATDADSPNLTYSIYGAQSNLFEHNGTHLIAKGGFGAADVPNRFFILLEAADSSLPPKTNRTQINIVVLRNYFDPQFNSTTNSFVINETQSLGLVFGQVFGFDLDVIAAESSVTFFTNSSLIGVTPTGGVFLRQQILTSSATSFSEQISIRDSGHPTRTLR